MILYNTLRVDIYLLNIKSNNALVASQTKPLVSIYNYILYIETEHTKNLRLTGVRITLSF
jgi:hypothetical protein